MRKEDIVYLKKENNEILYKISDIVEDDYFLEGIDYRIKVKAKKDEIIPIKRIRKISDDVNLYQSRNKDLKKGKVLHLDGDENYLRKCLDKYKEYDIEVYGYHFKENDMSNYITNLLIKHKPDILVITGHDSANELGENLNTGYFVSCVKKARICMPDQDSLVIFAGACQSNYEQLIESGANFASSTNNHNIHILDPVYIAIQIANTPVKEYVEVDKVLKNTVTKGKSLGGVDTKGVARRKYGG